MSRHSIAVTIRGANHGPLRQLSIGRRIALPLAELLQAVQFIISCVATRLVHQPAEQQQKQLEESLARDIALLRHPRPSAKILERVLNVEVETIAG